MKRHRNGQLKYDIGANPLIQQYMLKKTQGSVPRHQAAALASDSEMTGKMGHDFSQFQRKIVSKAACGGQGVHPLQTPV